MKILVTGGEQRMGDVLSQNEIDSLLAALSSGELDVDDIKDNGEKQVKDYDFARERVDGKTDFDKVAEMLRYYETALTNWREVREQIAQLLPKEKQKSYREITKQMHTRLYNDLVDLKEIRYQFRMIIVYSYGE